MLDEVSGWSVTSFGRWWRTATARSASVVAVTIMSLGATARPVPRIMIGTWAHGSCAKPGERLVITATTAALGGRTPAKVHYDSVGDGNGQAALHWNAEYDVDNFIYVRSRDAIIHNTQGFHMPGATLYRRCSQR